MAKREYDDDEGFTVIDMNVEGMPGYIKPEHLKNKRDIQKLHLTKKEKRALFWGSFLAIVPPFIIMTISFGIAILLIYFWLK